MDLEVYETFRDALLARPKLGLDSAMSTVLSLYTTMDSIIKQNTWRDKVKQLRNKFLKYNAKYKSNILRSITKPYILVHIVETLYEFRWLLKEMELPTEKVEMAELHYSDILMNLGEVR